MMWVEASPLFAASVILWAASLDFLIGDPWSWPHPVQWMGNWIAWGQGLSLRFCAPGWPRQIAGICLGLSTIALSFGLSGAIALLAQHLHPLFGWLTQVTLLASCLAARSLRAAAEEVLHPLSQGNLPAARSRLSRYVGRDTANLDESEILRALTETIAENTTDGVTAPLFFAILGAWTGVGAVPCAFAYKAASTLDSMIGYRREPFTDLGWFSAQLEDRLTWLPCRLTVGAIALLSGRPLHVWRLCIRDAPQDPSPNSGWSECAYAAALGVQLGGENWYKGELKCKPLLGEPEQKVAIATVQNALKLMRWTVWFWLIAFVVFPTVIHLNLVQRL